MSKIINPLATAEKKENASSTIPNRTYPKLQAARIFANNHEDALKQAIKLWGGTGDPDEVWYFVETNPFFVPGFKQEPFVPGGTVTKADHDLERQVKGSKYAWRVRIHSEQCATLDPRAPKTKKSESAGQ